MAVVEIVETKNVEVDEVQVCGYVYTIFELYYLLRDTIIPRGVKEKIVRLLIDGTWHSYGHMVGFIVNPYEEKVTLIFQKKSELAWPLSKDNSLIFVDMDELLKGLDC